LLGTGTVLQTRDVDQLLVISSHHRPMS
jgi:hypothetical protein